MTKRRNSDDGNLLLGKLLARVDQLEKDINRFNSIITSASWTLLALAGLLIVYFWRNPEVWLRLVKFLQ